MIDWDKAITAQQRAEARGAAAREAIRLRRDEAIRSGTTVAGIAVGTDDVTQTRIMGAAMAAMLDPAYSVSWKGADGTFVPLTGPQVIGVAQAIRAHVQACFDREAALLSDLVAERPYAIDDGWPVQVVRLANGAAVTHRVGAGVYRVATLESDWIAEPPEGLTVGLSHDGDALTVWVRRDHTLADIPTGQHVLLRPGSEA
ncbi:hypothetical protein PARHAE_02040 [Paracoccus haematequi]|uniref:DUF4376 domain-containing protein n=1 Tax=Paracoccus haematequi TaxID=2491866 RepID=A0A3S4CJB6_9RHOB|nr:DUF4376 domain-containing protein [Paracoccus haematequi]VDS08855.1 hypothetical protein PARHAE_02040 [Paracoccus haematequi]